MKKTTKALLLSLCAIMLVTVSVLGTMAYLTSNDEVINTFTVGKVNITLDEEDVDNSTPGDNDRDQENTYKLIPGVTYKKDPTIHVAADSEDCYLFVYIGNEIESLEEKPFSPNEPNKTIYHQMIKNGWRLVNPGIDDPDNAFYFYSTDTGPDPKPTVVRTNNKVVDKKIFDSFTIASDITNEKLSLYTSGIKIRVRAYAIQAAGFENMSANEILGALPIN